MTSSQTRRYLSRALIALILIYYVITNPPSASTPPSPITPTLVPASSSAVLGNSESQAIVSRVIDGDTIVLDTGEHVRYIGMNTPELASHQCYATEAKTANENLVLGKTVILVKDVSNTDKYGRLLRYVYVDGQFVNQVLVEEGFAQAVTYKPDIAHQVDFNAAQARAKAQNLGQWAACH